MCRQVLECVRDSAAFPLAPQCCAMAELLRKYDNIMGDPFDFDGCVIFKRHQILGLIYT